MTITQAVKKCFKEYATFSGRSVRSEYWWFAAFLFIAGVVLTFIDSTIFGAGVADPTPLSWLFSAATLVPSLAVNARRLHDIDRTAWWLLLAFAPVIGWIVLVYWACGGGTPGPNRFGPEPSAAT